MPYIEIIPDIEPTPALIANMMANGFLESDILVFAMQKGAIEAKKSAEVAKAILEDIRENQHIYLIFDKWDSENIYCTDDKGRQHVVIGDWNEHRFFVKGIVQRRSVYQQFRFLPNGQSSTGGIQIGYYAEEYTVEFPAIKEVNDAWIKAFDDRDKRVRDARMALFATMEGIQRFGKTFKVDRSSGTPLVCLDNGHCIYRADEAKAGGKGEKWTDLELIQNTISPLT